MKIVLESDQYYRFYADGGSYRYDFNNEETDPESDLQDYGMRIYNARLGKFLSVDPITEEYPELTPYQFASNRPIDGIDLDGLEYFGGSTFIGGNFKLLPDGQGGFTFQFGPVLQTSIYSINRLNPNPSSLQLGMYNGMRYGAEAMFSIHRSGTRYKTVRLDYFKTGLIYQDVSHIIPGPGNIYWGTGTDYSAMALWNRNVITPNEREGTQAHAKPIFPSGFSLEFMAHTSSDVKTFGVFNGVGQNGFTGGLMIHDPLHRVNRQWGVRASWSFDVIGGPISFRGNYVTSRGVFAYPYTSSGLTGEFNLTMRKARWNIFITPLIGANKL